jgi:glycosyltransferase involved in cell wall biosynthesis
MRILAVDLGRDWRGGQVQALSVARELAARGHAVTVAAAEGSVLAARAAAAGLDVATQPQGCEGSPSLLLRLALDVRRLRPDVIWTGEAKGHGAAVWSGAARHAPLVVHRRVVFHPGSNPLALLKYRAAARFLAVSEATRSVLEGSGVPASRIAVVEDGLDPTAFLERPSPSPPPYRLVHAGAFDGRKGQALVVEVVARLAAAGVDATASFLGEGPDRARVEQRARKLGVPDRCTFPGRVDDVPARLAGSHLLLLPSASEASPLVVLEAMAAGCAVLAHDTGGVGALLRGGTCGRLVAGLGPDAWSAAARDLLLDADARAALVAAGRASVAGRTSARTAALVEAELERATRSR